MNYLELKENQSNALNNFPVHYAFSKEQFQEVLTKLNIKESEAKDKLNKIANIWNNLIWKYKFCNRKIKFTQYVETNYIGYIFGSFHDTFEVVFKMELFYKQF
mgnify:CR=1 FL=1